MTAEDTGRDVSVVCWHLFVKDKNSGHTETGVFLESTEQTSGTDWRPCYIYRNLVLVTVLTIWLWFKADAGHREQTQTATKQHISPGTGREAESFRLAGKHTAK